MAAHADPAVEDCEINLHTWKVWWRLCGNAFRTCVETGVKKLDDKDVRNGSERYKTDIFRSSDSFSPVFFLI